MGKEKYSLKKEKSCILTTIKEIPGAEEMTLQLKILWRGPKFSSQHLYALWLTTIYNSNSRGSHTLFLPLLAPGTHKNAYNIQASKTLM